MDGWTHHPISSNTRMAHARMHAEGADGEAAAAGGAGEVDEATAAAIAFKNRLVEYDRNRWGL